MLAQFSQLQLLQRLLLVWQCILRVPQ
ncbi:unnamed protein product, partial [Cuscuta campestris]